VFRKNLIVLGFRLLFTPPLFPIDIRGAARPGQNFLPLGDHTEFGELKFPAPECLLMVPVCLAPGQNAGGPCVVSKLKSPVFITHEVSGFGLVLGVWL